MAVVLAVISLRHNESHEQAKCPVTEVATHEVPVAPPKVLPKVTETGAESIKLGEYQTQALAAKDRRSLEQYLLGCSDIPENWFCFPKLVDRIDIKQGAYSYFLILHGLTSAQLHSLCAFMWTTDKMSQWAKQNNHNCAQLSKQDLEP